ncbi:hypothetical protein B0H10DRAFT_1954590 [Mycena sp. CBHHK59/15]|nr:hypothetical protein B0H10DRAFT_1954590 [Mycena sp. CBHHK59/15]
MDLIPKGHSARMSVWKKGVVLRRTEESECGSLSSLWDRTQVYCTRNPSKMWIGGRGKRVRGNYMMGRLPAFSYGTGARAEMWEKYEIQLLSALHTGRRAKTYRETCCPHSIEDGCPGHLESIPGMIRVNSGVGVNLRVGIATKWGNSKADVSARCPCTIDLRERE